MLPGRSACNLTVLRILRTDGALDGRLCQQTRSGTRYVPVRTGPSLLPSCCLISSHIILLRPTPFPFHPISSHFIPFHPISSHSIPFHPSSSQIISWPSLTRIADNLNPCWSLVAIILRLQPEGLDGAMGHTCGDCRRGNGLMQLFELRKTPSTMGMLIGCVGWRGGVA